MATSDKDFRVKNGLVVQGATATVNGHNVLTDASSLNDFADVDTTGVAGGAPLIFNQTSLKWIPGTGLVNITVGDTKPTNPNVKDLFFNTLNGGLYIFYSDVDTSQWVQIGTSGPSGIVTVSSPLVNSGTATAAVLSINQSLLSIANTQVTGLGTASTKDVPTTGNATTSQVVKGDDTRLSDARTPTTHVHSAADITSGTLAIAQGGNGNALGSGLVPVVPASVAVPNGSASVSASGVVTFTNASEINLNSCFTSAYSSYKVFINLDSVGASSYLYLRLRGSGTNYTAGYYGCSLYARSNGTTGAWASRDAGANIIISQMGSSYTDGRINTVMDIVNPVPAAKPTAINTQGFAQDATSVMSIVGHYSHFTNSSDGISFGTDASNIYMNGTIHVYGYR